MGSPISTKNSSSTSRSPLLKRANRIGRTQQRFKALRICSRDCYRQSLHGLRLSGFADMFTCTDVMKRQNASKKNVVNFVTCRIVCRSARQSHLLSIQLSRLNLPSLKRLTTAQQQTQLW